MSRSERPAEDRDVSESERFSVNTDETDRRKRTPGERARETPESSALA